LDAIVKGTSAETVIEALERIPGERLNQVREGVTLDMAERMRKIVRRCFPNARRVTDRFHVQKLAYDALQQVRKNIAGMLKRTSKRKLSKYGPFIHANGDTLKQLLARNRYPAFQIA
jgi:transposase